MEGYRYRLSIRATAGIFLSPVSSAPPGNNTEKYIHTVYCDISGRSRQNVSFTLKPFHFCLYKIKKRTKSIIKTPYILKDRRELIVTNKSVALKDQNVRSGCACVEMKTCSGMDTSKLFHTIFTWVDRGTFGSRWVQRTLPCLTLKERQPSKMYF